MVTKTREIQISEALTQASGYEGFSGSTTINTTPQGKKLSLTYWSETYPSSLSPGGTKTVEGTTFKITDVALSEETLALERGGHSVRVWKITLSGVEVGTPAEDSETLRSRVVFRSELKGATKYETKNSSTTVAGVEIQKMSLEVWSDTTANIPTAGSTVPGYASYTCTAASASREVQDDGTELWKISAEGILSSQYEPETLLESSKRKAYTLNGTIEKAIDGDDVLLRPSGAKKDWTLSQSWLQTSSTPPTYPGSTYDGGTVTDVSMERIRIRRPGVSDTTIYRVDVTVKGQS